MPYALLDERTKKSNRDSLREAVRTFVGYGYNIEPSDQELGELSLFILVLVDSTGPFLQKCWLWISLKCTIRNDTCTKEHWSKWSILTSDGGEEGEPCLNSMVSTSVAQSHKE